MTTTPTPFSALLAALRPHDGTFAVDLPPDWLQGRTAYGGLSAALCLEAALVAASDLPPLRSAQFCFVGPAAGTLRIAPRVLRRGKSAVLVAVDVEGESGTAVRGTLCFGSSRAAAHDHVALVRPQVDAPDACTAYYDWPERPNFMNHFDGRLAAGARPRTPGHEPHMTVWLRHRDDDGSGHPMVRLLALADALPPPALVLYQQVVMISTITWSVDVVDTTPATIDGWWLAHAQADTSHHGYSAQGTVIWNVDGTPALIARQNVAIFG